MFACSEAPEGVICTIAAFKKGEKLDDFGINQNEWLGEIYNYHTLVIGVIR